MAAPSSFTDQATSLLAAATRLAPSGEIPLEEKTRLIESINTLAERIRESGALNEDKTNALRLLDQAIFNTGFPGRFHFNLMDPFNLPAPICKAYGDYPVYMQIPFVDCYMFAVVSRSVARIDPRVHAESIPQTLRDQVGFDPANTDFFFLFESATNADSIQGDHGGYHFERESREVLVRFHHVVFRDETKGCDKKVYVPMGAFPLYGARQAQFWPIPIDHLEPMEVYAHPRDDIMLYSPDGAHLELDTDIPYSVFWIAGQHGGRTCLAKVICKNRGGVYSPAIERLFEAQSGCDTLDDFKRQLSAAEPFLRRELAEQFDPLVRALESGAEADIEAAFAALPRTYQENIYKQIWLLKGSPRDVHANFGRASFENDASLPAPYHASTEDKLRAVALIQEDVINELIHSQIAMLSLRSVRRILPAREPAAAPAASGGGSSHPLATTSDRTAARVDTLRPCGGAGSRPEAVVPRLPPAALTRPLDTPRIAPSSTPSSQAPPFEMKTIYLTHSPGVGRKIELRGGFPDGSGKTLKIRGRELTWEHGIDMECTAEEEGTALWETSVEIPSIPDFSFKFVVVDADGKELYWLPEENISITTYDPFSS